MMHGNKVGIQRQSNTLVAQNAQVNTVSKRTWGNRVLGKNPG